MEEIVNLIKQELRIAMITGDNQLKPSKITKNDGIDTIMADVSPGENAEEVNEKIQKAGGLKLDLRYTSTRTS